MNAQAIVSDFRSEVSHFADFKLSELREAASILGVKKRGNLNKVDLISKLFEKVLATSIKEGIISIRHQKQIKMADKPPIPERTPRLGTKSYEVLKYMKIHASLTNQEVARDLKVNSALVRHVKMLYLDQKK